MTQTETTTYGYVSDKAALIKRLHKIEGLMRSEALRAAVRVVFQRMTVRHRRSLPKPASG